MTTTPEQLAALTKRCSRCHKVKPWTEYYARSRWEDGSVRAVTAACKPCHNAARLDAYHAKPGSKSESCRLYRERLKSDPDRLARYREGERFYSRAWRLRNGGRAGTHTKIDRSPTVDAAPFAAWLSEKVAEYGGVLQLAAACGMNDTRVRKIKNGGIPRVELSQVDAALQAEGSTMLDELYEMEGSTT